jgi:hypothetical protein
MLPLWATASLPLLHDHRKRLRVAAPAVAGRGVARVADRQLAGQRGQHRLGENIRHVPHLFARIDEVAVGGADAGASWPRCCNAYSPR